MQSVKLRYEQEMKDDVNSLNSLCGICSKRDADLIASKVLESVNHHSPEGLLKMFSLIGSLLQKRGVKVFPMAQRTVGTIFKKNGWKMVVQK